MSQNGTHWNRELAAKLIIEQGRKPKWVAQKCGITDHWLRAILQGKAKPSLSVVKCLAAALGVHEDALLKVAA